MDSSDDDDEIAMNTRGFKNFLKRKIFLRQRDNKKYDGKKNKSLLAMNARNRITLEVTQAQVQEQRRKG